MIPISTTSNVIILIFEKMRDEKKSPIIFNLFARDKRSNECLAFYVTFGHRLQYKYNVLV